MTAWRMTGDIEVCDLVNRELFDELAAWNAKITYLMVHEGGRRATLTFEMAHASAAKKTEFLEDIHALDSVVTVGFHRE